jgi:glycosyltransferase involved in cell wall biosynthesis
MTRQARSGEGTASTRSEGPKLTHVYFADSFRFENRTRRATRTALETGLFGAVDCVGYTDASEPREETLPYGATARHIPLTEFRSVPRRYRRILLFPVWNWKAFWALRRADPDVVYCSSLASLPAAVAHKLTHPGRGLVYDAHELETDRPMWPKPVRGALRVMERWLVRAADHMLVVSDSIRDWYVAEYGVERITTVRNVPIVRPERVEPNDALRRELGIPEHASIFIYVGMLAGARGIELAFQAFEGLGDARHLVLMGWGPLEAEVRQHARTHSNVHFKPAVPMDQVVRVTAGADVGLMVTEETGSLSYRYALPNKIFEYLHAGIPAMVGTNMTELTRLVADYQAGWAIEPTVEAMRQLVQSLDRATIQKARDGMRPTQDLRWEVEQERLVPIFRAALSGRRRAG